MHKFLTRVWKICMSNVTKITLSHLLPTGKVMAATMTLHDYIPVTMEMLLSNKAINSGITKGKDFARHLLNFHVKEANIPMHTLPLLTELPCPGLP